MLQYQVDKNGMVVKVQELKGGSYELTSQKVDSFPPIYRTDRWTQFKRTVATQEVNVIMKYSGFKDADELKRACSVLSRQNKDVFLKSILNGAVLVVRQDTINLELYVSKVEKK